MKRFLKDVLFCFFAILLVIGMCLLGEVDD